MMLDLNAIKERAEKAVPGPWRYDGMHYEITAPFSENGYWVIASECRTRPDGPYECDQFGHEFDPTFDFIAHAREDISVLLAELEAQQQPCVWTILTMPGGGRLCCSPHSPVWFDDPKTADWTVCPVCRAPLVRKVNDA